MDKQLELYMHNDYLRLRLQENPNLLDTTAIFLEFFLDGAPGSLFFSAN